MCFLITMLISLCASKIHHSRIRCAEVGPRVCLQPIKILSGSFNGPVLWENESYVSPNVIRAAQKRKKGQQYEQKVEQKAKRKQHVAANQLQPDELKQLFKQFGSSSAKFQSLEDDAVE